MAFEIKRLDLRFKYQKRSGLRKVYGESISDEFKNLEEAGRSLTFSGKLKVTIVDSWGERFQVRLDALVNSPEERWLVASTKIMLVQIEVNGPYVLEEERIGPGDGLDELKTMDQEQLSPFLTWVSTLIVTDMTRETGGGVALKHEVKRSVCDSSWALLGRCQVSSWI